jgi:hypothetical protein
MQILKQSTGTSVQVGPFMYAKGTVAGVTAITDLAVGEVSAAGGSANFCKLSYGAGVSVNVSPKDWAHVGNGRYMMEIAGASIATAGPARIHFTSATPDFVPFSEDLFIMHGTLYDIFISGAWSGVSIGGVSKTAGITQSGVSNIFDGVVDVSAVSVFSLKECIKLQNSVSFGKASGGGGTTTAFRDLADSKNRVDGVVDSSGNRTTVSWDGT